MECDQLWDRYTNLRIKYRLTVTAARQGACAAEVLDKVQADSEAARRNLQEHKLAHDPKSQSPEVRNVVRNVVEKRDRGDRIFLLPAVTPASIQ